MTFLERHTLIRPHSEPLIIVWRSSCYLLKFNEWQHVIINRWLIIFLFRTTTIELTIEKKKSKLQNWPSTIPGVADLVWGNSEWSWQNAQSLNHSSFALFLFSSASSRPFHHKDWYGLQSTGTSPRSPARTPDRLLNLHIDLLKRRKRNNKVLYI